MDPLWQKDSDVASCFLCNTPYTLFNRRHHCRKCGRVVCGSCSEKPVKYFPSSYVVNPDDKLSRVRLGESYRTCDECVEEINMIRTAIFGPPATSQASSVSSTRNSSVREDNTNDNDSTTKYLTNTSTRMLASSTDSSLIRKDDESDANLCPICARNLLKQYISDRKKSSTINDISHDDFESFKESHIQGCLTSFDFAQDTQRLGSGSKSHTRNKMLVYNMPPIPRPKYESIPQMEGTSVDTFKVEDDIVGSVNSHSTLPSEKPDLDVDNECVICLEDLKPGDKVGRLECLCVFHYKCIKDWFNKKGYGECPVHFIHQ